MPEENKLKWWPKNPHANIHNYGNVVDNYQYYPSESEIENRKIWQEASDQIYKVYQKHKFERRIDTLMPVVPQTYGEAIQMYPWIKCEGHEWDNRTTPQNAVWLIQKYQKRESKAVELLREILPHASKLERAFHDDPINFRIWLTKLKSLLNNQEE